MASHKSPCVVCILRPLIWLGRFCGFTPVATNCSKTNSPCIFKISWIWIIFSTLNALLMCGMIVFSINDFNENHISTTSTDIMQHVIITIDSMNQVTSIILILINILQAGPRSKALNAISKIMYEPKYGIVRAISLKSERNLFKVTLRQIIIVILLLIVQNIFTITALWKNDPHIHFQTFVIKGFCFSISNCVFIMTGLEFSVLTSLIRHMLREVDSQLQNILLKANNRSESTNQFEHFHSKNVWTITVAHKKMDREEKLHGKQYYLCDQIGEIRLAYCDIIKCVRYLNRSMNPQLVLLTILVMISIVLNMYLIIQFIIEKTGKILFVVSLLRLLVNVGTVLHMISKAELLRKRAKLMLQHIVTTETKTFTFHELTQIELMIKQIYTQPPRFTASDVFYFNAEILASMFGAVITFVLVAIQFDFNQIVDKKH